MSLSACSAWLSARPSVCVSVWRFFCTLITEHNNAYTNNSHTERTNGPYIGLQFMFFFYEQKMINNCVICARLALEIVQNCYHVAVGPLTNCKKAELYFSLAQ